MRYITAALQIRQFSIDQYIDIFQFISKQIQDIIRDYYINAHAMNLPVIIDQIMDLKGDGDGTGQSRQEVIYRDSENFIRSFIASAFGLQVFDNFINSITRALGQELESSGQQAILTSFGLKPGADHFSVYEKKVNR